MKYITNAPAGRDLLNTEQPGWFRNVDPDTLDMDIPELCTLGQVFGSYGQGKAYLFGGDTKESWRFGFAAMIYESERMRWATGKEMERLTLEWQHIVTELQAADR